MTVLAVVNPLVGIGHMLSHPFLARAFVAGTLISAATGLVGYFVVLRSQVFTGDALSHVAFTGGMAALAAHLDVRLGLFAGCVAFAMAMGALGDRGRADDVVIGNVFAWILGLGVLFLTIYTTSASAGNGAVSINVLFGSIYGLTATQSTIASIVAVGLIVAMLAIIRPLLFASIDQSVAAARGVPVRLLGFAFLVLVGITAGEATEAVGALLLLGLLSAPAAAAQRLTNRPYPAMALSTGLAVLSVWAGLSLSYADPSISASFAVLAMATASYVLALGWSVLRRSRTRRPPAPAPA
jgi:zinc/manganese transport system permease protein